MHRNTEKGGHIGLMEVSYIETILSTMVSKTSYNTDVCDKDRGWIESITSSGELDHTLGMIVLIEYTQ